MQGIGINTVPAISVVSIRFIGGWDSRLQIITIACALHCYAMQENTELTAYRKDSIRQRWIGKKNAEK